MFKYYFFKIIQILTSLFPLTVVYRTAVFLADLKYFFSKKDKLAVKENLHVISPGSTDAEINVMARDVFRNFSKYLVEFFRMPTFTEEFVRARMSLENQHYLDEALKKGKGVIIMTAHIGNWELGGLTLGRFGYPLTAIALPHKEPAVNQLFNQQRAEGGVNVVPVNLAIRRCLQTLKQNGVIALLADRDFSATGSAMPFFGKETMIPRGIAMFAYRTQAPVLPMFLRREDNLRFKIFIDEPLLFPENSENMNEQEFTQQLMEQQVAVIEKEVQRDPSQWLIFRRFWIDQKTGPERITST